MCLVFTLIAVISNLDLHLLQEQETHRLIDLIPFYRLWFEVPWLLRVLLQINVYVI